MKIAITSDPMIPVPPKLYGGIERIIDMLIKGLTARGHKITLFAHRDSEVACNFVPYKGESATNKWDTFRNMQQVNTVLKGNYDVVHSFGRIAYMTMLLPSPLPKIMSYQREPSLKMVRLAMKLARKNTLSFTGCSSYIADQIKPYAPAYAIPNGVPIESYTFRPQVAEDAPLVFLGRIEHIKGTHLAIEVAQKTGRKLIIAGNIPPDKASQDYFNHKVKPYLDDKQITYIGAVNDEQKNQLLGSAYAFLMPILWNEPFGIVMAEALACGTPVIGFNRGAVPEVVEDGVNGFICEDVAQMVKSISDVTELNRCTSRQIAEEKFSNTAIVNAYEALYHKIIKLKV